MLYGDHVKRIALASLAKIDSDHLLIEATFSPVSWGLKMPTKYLMLDVRGD